jgi:hypothetical protein
MNTRTITGGTDTVASLLTNKIGLQNIRAEGVTLVGPAIFAAGSYRFEGRQTLDGRPDDIIWDIAESRETAVGAVIVEECIFVDCTFQHIGWVVTPSTQAAFLAGLAVA